MKLISNDTDLRGLDCHVHSRFSPDALHAGTGTPQEIADAARSRGLRGFIVTDHLDVGHWRGYLIDFEKYFSEWEKVRRDNPDLTIYIGLEVGFEAAHAAETARIISDLPLEYVINSVHYWQPVHDGSEWERGRKTVYREYLEAVAASLDAPYEFSTVGHLGYPERYAPYPENDRVFKYGEFRKLFDDIIKKAVCRGARLEENTNGGGELKLPRADLLQAYKAAGGKRPVTASDAHTIGAIGQRFKEAETFLDGIFGNE